MLKIQMLSYNPNVLSCDKLKKKRKRKKSLNFPFFFFFLIGNKTFIEKMNIVFMMMNTLDMKKIQKARAKANS